MISTPFNCNKQHRFMLRRPCEKRELMSNPELSDEVEIVEVGEGDIAVLLAALRRLNNGVYALKVTVDFLNSRMGTLLDTVKELEKSLNFHLEGFKAEKEAFTNESRRTLEEYRKETRGLSQEMRLSMDLFFEKLSGEMEKLYDSIRAIDSNINTLLSQLKEVELVLTDTAAALKAETTSLRAKYSETESLVSELSQKTSRLEETILAAVSELRLALHELSLKVLELEKLLGEMKGERALKPQDTTPSDTKL